MNKQEVDKSLSNSVNTEFVLDMQRKLHCWSRSNTNQVFDDLFNLVCDRRSLWHAWAQLCRNRGSQTPGVDAMNRRKVEKRPGGVDRFLEEIRERLRSGTYALQPVRQRLIPKPGKPGKFRPLGIPTLTDRLVQMALRNVLEPIFEADFYPTSYGFRRGRSTIDALAMIQRQLAPTQFGPSRVAYVIEGDIKGCFDNIDHHLLMERIRRRVGDRKVLRLILSFLKAGVMAEGNVVHPVAGAPQGGIISPLLANIMLTALDERYGRWTPQPHEPCHRAQQRRTRDRNRKRPTFFMVRYADDFVVLVTGTKEDAEHEKSNLATFLKERLHLELSVEKTHITRPEDGFEFLGYRVIREPSQRSGLPVGKLRIPKGKMQELRNRLKKRTDMSTTNRSLEDILKGLSPVITGWRNYYRYATGAWKDFLRLDWWLTHRIRRWLKKKHPKNTWRAIYRQYAQRESATRWAWGENGVLLRRFGQGGTSYYRCRGFRISNGWNERLDGVRPYPEAVPPISGYIWTGVLL